MTDLMNILETGGRNCLELLELSIQTMRSDVIFVYLERDFRLNPRLTAALALYDCFCVSGAPIPLSTNTEAAGPDYTLIAHIERLRSEWESIVADAGDEHIHTERLFAPDRNLFSSRSVQVKEESQHLQEIAELFDPQLSSSELLLNCKRSEVHRFFVEQTWKRMCRPVLVNAGFWRIATVGH